MDFTVKFTYYTVRTSFLPIYNSVQQPETIVVLELWALNLI